MTIVADRYDYVVGVDTHARTHTYTVLETRTASVIDTSSFPASKAGLARAVSWVKRRAPGEIFAAVEGTSSYGAQISAAMIRQGIDVAEVRPPSRAARARTGKSDALDAEAAARSVLGTDITHVAKPRSDGDRQAMRVLLAARALIDQQRTANRNALTALLRTVDLGIDARRPLRQAQIDTIAAWRETSTTDPTTTVARAEARRLAQAILQASKELEANRALLSEYAEQRAPGLQNLLGLGPVTAAIILCAYSHHGRVRSEAAFAALAGASPLPASSGNTTRHRLNRSGDRQLNRALDVIVRTRMSCDPKTKEYVEKSTLRGKTKRETRRVLKRYVARSLYRHLQSLLA